MKLKQFYLILLLMFIGQVGFSQKTPVYGISDQLQILQGTPVLSFSAPDREKLRLEDEIREKNGEFYRIGVASYTDITESNSGIRTTDKNGNRIWQLHIKHSGAEALSFLFKTFQLYDKSTFDVFDIYGKKLHKTLTAADVHEHLQQHIPLCFGDEMILQLTEPELSRKSEFQLEQIMFNYRATGNPLADKDFGGSGNCEVNVNCSPAGDIWQDEKRGIARIYVVVGSQAGWCSGSLVNNLAQNCKPYVLTAQHCGVGATASNFNNWIFNFAYEASGCSDPASDDAINISSKRISGCFLVSKSDGVSGDYIVSSDFLLVQLGTQATETAIVTKLKSAAINAYWNGWDANNIPATGGAGIHHPAGDIKKISTYTATATSTNYSQGAVNTHWRIIWTANPNGHGVTEGGSSGSPLFNTNGGNSRIVGTLSGGTSYCWALSDPDLYGKMSYHWASNGTATNKQLKPFLDPNNTGVLICNGSSNPCVTSTPIADFIATPVTVNPGGTVYFTDQSTNSPTSWSWTITPNAGWAYANSTSAASQNPQVTFNTQGTYTVSLTAANTSGSDTETKENYITVTIVSEPCGASVVNCDEYISKVTLGSINNPSGCSKYISYETPQTTLTRTQQYNLIVVPSIDGEEGAYTGDEIAAWIDWNHDYDFSDEGERIAYVMVGTGWNNQFLFNVPEDASTGQLTMRVRISYNPQEGPIEPCGETLYGEVEDYKINVIAEPLSLDETVLSGIGIYPNPGNEAVTIDAGSAGTIVLAELTDLTGKVILTKSVLSKESFDISALPMGSYLFRISSGEKVAVKPFIKL